MKIDNVKVYGLEESIVASGLPMVENYDGPIFGEHVDALVRLRENVASEIQDRQVDVDDLCKEADKSDAAFLSRHLKRAKTLASCAGGESHDCFLAGVVVQFNMTAPRFFFPEFMRYHFEDIVSSSSTMHKLKKFVQEYIQADERHDGETCEKLIAAHFSPDTSRAMICAFLGVAGRWLKDGDHDIQELKSALPEGWIQTARITTNYRQLRSMARQRHNHGLKEWRDFCAWIETLPLAQDLILGGSKKESAE